MALGWLVREHHDDASDDFVTAFVAVVDVATGGCHWANAGHPPALVVADGTAVELSHSGPLIGSFDSAWSTETIVIPPNGVLLAYTDGLTEARGLDRSRLGEDRLQECVQSSVSEAGAPRRSSSR
jgi:serine phosphatase RsbU (regulator of sigma subunit)